MLVNGAGGGVGTFAVQIAKSLGAHVTGVTKTPSLPLVRSIGADEVMDYRHEDFTRNDTRYDVIFDAGGNHSLSQLLRVVSPTGAVVLAAPAGGQWAGPIARVLAASVRSRMSRRTLRVFLAKATTPDLLRLKDLCDAGELRPIIDRTYGFDDIPAAIRFLESGHVQGKVVVRI